MNTRRATLVLAVALAGCGIDDVIESSGQEIVRGEVSAAGAHPATVYLWLGGGSCSGTLITPRVVLTARHCLSGTSTGSLEVFFGNDVDQEGTWVGVQHYATNGSGDIAILTMQEPGPTEPIAYSPTTLTSADIGTPVYLVGFGDTGGSGGAGVKREGATTIEDLDGDVMYVGSSGAKTCFGDSGGPTFIDWPDGRRVAAVSSFITTGDCNSGSSGNVRTDVYADWIQAYLDEHDPASCDGDGQCAAGCGAPDPDCPCAADGYCTADCPDVATDPDCAGCGDDGTCRADCPALDLDCCADDGACVDECGPQLDPDCAPDDDPPPDDGDPADPDDGDGAAPTVSGGCAAGGGAADWPLALVLLAPFIRRRRGASSRTAARRP